MSERQCNIYRKKITTPSFVVASASTATAGRERARARAHGGARQLRRGEATWCREGSTEKKRRGDVKHRERIYIEQLETFLKTVDRGDIYSM